MNEKTYKTLCGAPESHIRIAIQAVMTRGQETLRATPLAAINDGLSNLSGFMEPEEIHKIASLVGLLAGIDPAELLAYIWDMPRVPRRSRV